MNDVNMRELLDRARGAAASLRQTRRQALLAMLLGFSAILMAGCGGGSGTATPANYTGAYTSRVALDAGRTAAVNMAVAQNGAITGSMTVDDGRASRAVVATYSLSGLLDLITGRYSITGTASTATPPSTTLTGTLPIPNGTALGTLSVALGSSIFNSSISGTVTASGGGQSTVTFSSASAYNGNSATYAGTTISSIITVPIIGQTANLLVATTDGKRQVSINLNATLTAGRTFTPGDDNTIVHYLDNGKIWSGQGGQIVIDTVSGSSVTFRAIDVPMSPYPVINGGPSASGSVGTFTLNVNNTTSGNNNSGGTTTAGLTISGSTGNTAILKNGAFNGTAGASKTVGAFTLNGKTYDGQYNVDYTATGASFGIDIFGLNLSAGDVFQVTDPRISLNYLETAIGRFDADSGAITIESISAGQIVVSLTNVHFTGAAPAAGAFTVSGKITAPIH